MLAIRRIPPAPRRVRWGAVVWFRWPLAVVGVFCGVIGGIASVMLLIATPRHRDDAQLDRGPNEIVAGTVEGQRPTRITMAGEPAIRATFVYVPVDGQWPEKRTCFVPESIGEIGSRVEVEHLRARPQAARIVGGRLTMQPDLWTPWMLFVVLPGLACLVSWAAGVVRLRHMMQSADITLADEYEIRRDVWSVPETLEVRFWFRDHRAQRVFGRHWLRVRSAAGDYLTSTPRPRRLAVAHDRRHPERWHRVVHENDFQALHSSAAEPAPGSIQA